MIEDEGLVSDRMRPDHEGPCVQNKEAKTSLEP